MKMHLAKLINPILRRWTLANFWLRFLVIILTTFSLNVIATERSVVESPKKTTDSELSSTKETKDKILNALIRYFSQADAIHKEAWWVLSGEKRPEGKSPFGKVERALMSSSHVKLANKSLFRCDRYIVNRQTLSLSGYPQKFSIFEKCNLKLAERKIAEVTFAKVLELQVIFFPENLEEVLGLGPTILNKPIECSMVVNASEILTAMNCKNWSQDRIMDIAKQTSPQQVPGQPVMKGRNKKTDLDSARKSSTQTASEVVSDANNGSVQMVRLDRYDYQKDAADMIRMTGKIFENLVDTRKIEAIVPREGKIQVTETELYAPPKSDPAQKVHTTPGIVKTQGTKAAQNVGKGALPGGLIPVPRNQEAPLMETQPGSDGAPMPGPLAAPAKVKGPDPVPVPPGAENIMEPQRESPESTPADEGWPEGEMPASSPSEQPESAPIGR